MHAYSLNKRSSYVSEFDVELRAFCNHASITNPSMLNAMMQVYLHSSFCHKLTLRLQAFKGPNQIRYMSVATNDMRSSQKLSIIARCKSILIASHCSPCIVYGSYSLKSFTNSPIKWCSFILYNSR